MTARSLSVKRTASRYGVVRRRRTHGSPRHLGVGFTVRTRVRRVTLGRNGPEIGETDRAEIAAFCDTDPQARSLRFGQRCATAQRAGYGRPAAAIRRLG